MPYSSFAEDNSDFYDLEYFLSLEYRYFSGAHSSRINNILSLLGEVKYKKILDVGCGCGFFDSEFSKRGAEVVGVDYSRYAVDFSSARYPELKFSVSSAYGLEEFKDNEFDLVTLIDTVEHLSDQDKALKAIKRVLKPGGRLVVATDVDGDKWQGKYFKPLIRFSQRFSAAGRAFKLIQKTEARRRQIKNYHASHVNELNFEDLKKLLAGNGFYIVQHKIYPVIGVPIRDIILRFLPLAYRGDHQCLAAVNEK